ncbi:hypothetical protein ACFOLF_14935 [Paenibacillus sepulcri]|uniref:Uncharacterized protein n=1 Tax=Paenibacillus sepulcri TaxID=359917 RepID=A0ABS7C748_9BACL|nr:hypothetical protein [Paenibacillus sepulcri]
MTEQKKTSGTEALETTVDIQTTKEDSAIDAFASQIKRLKELDLTGIEPLLPPTWKAERYSRD